MSKIISLDVCSSWSGCDSSADETAVVAGGEAVVGAGSVESLQGIEIMGEEN